jgi:hypothetical protein
MWKVFACSIKSELVGDMHDKSFEDGVVAENCSGSLYMILAVERGRVFDRVSVQEAVSLVSLQAWLSRL